MSQLRAVSYLAPNWFEFYEAVVNHLGQALQIETHLLQSDRDPLEDPLLLQDQIDLMFICGLPFIRQHQRVPRQLQAIVAPVMQLPRYQKQPIYFSDVIVNASSNLKTFADLAGKAACYNDPGSNSGYYLLRYRLLEQDNPFFGKVLQSGSHQHSIRWVVKGLADCAAIDSTVLERELQHFPELSNQLRIVESIGPCPAPPIAIAQHLDPAVIHQIQSALLHPHPALETKMKRMGICHYAKVTSQDYDKLADIYNAVTKANCTL